MKELLDFELAILTNVNKSSSSNGVLFWGSQLQKVIEQKLLEASVCAPTNVHSFISLKMLKL